MSLTASLGATATPGERLEVITAEIERDELCGATGARSVAALVAWKLGVSSANAHTITSGDGDRQAATGCRVGLAQ